MRKILLSGILLILGLHPGIWAQASVTAELSGTRIVIGDQVNLQIRVSRTGKAQVDIDLKPLAETKGLEIIKESDPVMKEDPGISYLEKNVTLTSFDSGEYVVPPLTVRLLEDGGQVQELRTNPIPLEVLTIPIASDSLQLAPIKGIEEEPFTFRDSLPYLLGAAGLGLIAFLVWWFRFRKQPLGSKNLPVISRPPHEVALDKLDALEKQQLWQQGRIKEYYSELTYIAREYLENRFEIPALENTTGEILQKLKVFPEIDQSLANQLRRILTSSDMVKFAKAEPAASFHTEALSQTRQFVTITQQKPQPAEPVGDDQLQDKFDGIEKSAK